MRVEGGSDARQTFNLRYLRVYEEKKNLLKDVECRIHELKSKYCFRQNNIMY
jgi:hypothetical protein